MRPQRKSVLEQAQSPPTRPYPCLPTVSSSQLPPFRALPLAGTSYITWKYLETMPCPQHLGGPGRGLAGTEMLYRDGGTAWAHFHSCGLASARPQLSPPARLPPLPHPAPLTSQKLRPETTLSAHRRRGNPFPGSAAGEVGGAWPKSRTVFLSKPSIGNTLIAAAHF